MGDNAVVEVKQLKVRLHLLAPDQGGRRSAIRSGYCCQWRSDRKPGWNDARVVLDGDLVPGDEVEAWLVLAVPRFWKDAVEIGDALEGGEGWRVVARAVVLDRASS